MQIRRPPSSELTSRSHLPTFGRWPGAKEAAGVAHRIIQQMPPHAHYFELFLGHGTVIRSKRRAPGRNVGTDVDGQLIQKWWNLPWPESEAINDLEIRRGEACRILTSDPTLQDPDALVYLDPPYLRAVRSRRRLYRFEFDTPAHHARLLEIAIAMPCKIMLSGYPSALYSTMLEGRDNWRFIDYTAPTRGGPRIERLWMNFPPAATLHDPRFGGTGYRDRDRVRRKRMRWAAKFAAMPQWERQMIRDALDAAELTGGDRHE